MSKKLGISALNDNIYYGTVGTDKDGLEYWKSKTKIDRSDFVFAMLTFIQRNVDDNGVMMITSNDKPKYLLKFEKVSNDETQGQVSNGDQD